MKNTTCSVLQKFLGTFISDNREKPLKINLFKLAENYGALTG